MVSMRPGAAAHGTMTTTSTGEAAACVRYSLASDVHKSKRRSFGACTASHHVTVLVLHAEPLTLTQSFEKLPDSLRQGRLHLSSSLEVSGLIAGLAQAEPFPFQELWGFDCYRQGGHES